MLQWNAGDLNPEQEQAILAPGSVFLIACPGSGKTRTLTYKIAHELSKLSGSKQWVVALTYTNRAADEIHERIEALGVDTSQLWIGTIHSFCLEWILKPYHLYLPQLAHGFRLIDQHDAEVILTKLYASFSPKGLGVTYWDCGYYVKGDGYHLTCLNDQKHATVKKILQAYLKILKDNRQIDFELLLYYAHKLISKNPSIPKLLSNLFSCVLVDEYQDTKEIQYSIVSAILTAGAGKTNILIVGDPNQAIYKSLGGYAISVADFRAMADIPITEMSLSLNYRSSDKITKYFSEYNVHATKIESAGKHKDYASTITRNNTVVKDGIDTELERLIRHNIETKGIAQNEICILAPQWVHLASMTRSLAARMPEYVFDGPGMVPFSRDVENFWYKLSKICLTSASPALYVRRTRWAAEILRELALAGVAVPEHTSKSFLRLCNTIQVTETDGLKYLRQFFADLFRAFGVDYREFAHLKEHYDAFFDSSQSRIDRLAKEGSSFISDITAFRNVFKDKSGITISTIHGIKGDEYDVVIAYALLEGMVPHFNDGDGDISAKKLLYVICSRARKNLHLISETGRKRGRYDVYGPTNVLAGYQYGYDVV